MPNMWKFIYYVAAPNQLFNLETDPDELDNVIETFPDVAGELESQLRAVCAPEIEKRRAEGFIEDQVLAIASV